MPLNCSYSVSVCLICANKSRSANLSRFTASAVSHPFLRLLAHCWHSGGFCECKDPERLAGVAHCLSTLKKLWLTCVRGASGDGTSGVTHEDLPGRVHRCTSLSRSSRDLRRCCQAASRLMGGFPPRAEWPRRVLYRWRNRSRPRVRRLLDVHGSGVGPFVEQGPVEPFCFAVGPGAAGLDEPSFELPG
jgi:hypothetical protein